MLNATEAAAAVEALEYPGHLNDPKDRDAHIAAHNAYREAVGNINTEFKNWLANEYAPTLPAEVQDRIWAKAWMDGHSNGYSEIENCYIDNADFAQFIYNAKK